MARHIIMKYCLLFLLLVANTVCAQNTVAPDTSHQLQNVVISGFQSNNKAATSLNIEGYSRQQMCDNAPFNLSDALAKMPGISQMSTGNSISKPVIRGLYGNRILVLYSGLRFDNQQWQDEHGLGLSQIGLDRVEIIKGPASLLYGSDAMGGVINVIEEKPVAEGYKADIGTQLFANTRGTLTDAGISKRHKDSWWRVRLGLENHADYSDGKGARVLNSRNQGYYLKAGMGFKRKNWTQENTFNFSLNKFGFIMEDLSSSFAPDGRWERGMNGPHHIVVLNLFNSQNTFQLKSSRLQLNAGVQSNIRMEDEGAGQISLNMHLFSALQNLKWEKQLRKNLSFTGNQQLTFENNTNYGGRIIIPDASFMELNLAGYLKWTRNKFIAEAGGGINSKYIHTIATRSLNIPGEAIQPFTRNNITGNGMVGAVYMPADGVNLKFNASTGSRSPNLAELSSNGLHEGVYRYEIGDPNLKIEQNLNTDIDVLVNKGSWAAGASGYYNQFFNYVYLTPTTEKFYGFPVYRYKQQGALIYGGEFFGTYTPAGKKEWQLKEVFAITNGVLADGNYLPFIPAYKSTTSLRYEKIRTGKITRIFVAPELVYVFKQDRPAQFETMTGSYALLNLSSGITINTVSGNWQIGLAGTNLTNTVYADHLSRLKYYGLNNQGRNIVLSLRKDFKW
ncbi:hypothetical protein CJD36_018725 [Flavipsychrobacter stenotrophus]|uniref:TonB-dependent receptor n=2 Tax=Flavipsychrobacter stenotrophus TaxID=2077091 RepID=A0A2S7SRQ0_9BACT|nr:hypothetical protein CJD36_018725 [Flavipsychrobacter stenotrophus]